MHMVLLETADNAVTAAAIIAGRLPETLSVTAKELYTALCGAAVEVMKERGYKETVTEITYFCPAEAVALAVGVHPSTIYRKLPELRAAGLVDCRGHYCTHNGQTRSDGSVWTIRLTPTWGSAARVPFDYLKRSYRCLGDDIEASRTAFLQMRESYLLRDKSGINLSHILRWALPPTNKTPVISDSRKVQRFDLESIFDVPTVRKQDRAEMVYNAAKALTIALRDDDSTRFYCGLLWGLLRLRDRGQGDYFESLYLMAQRARTDVLEGFSRRGGALFTSRVKQAPWWDEVMRQPTVRVGTLPKN
jgi:hypothetical protein